VRGKGKEGPEADHAGVKTVAKAIPLGRGGQLDCGAGCGGDREGSCRCEEEGTGVVDQMGPEEAVAGNEGAAASEGLAQSSDEHIGVQAEVRTESFPVGSKGSEGMSFVHDEGSLVIGGDGGQVREGRRVAVHAEEGLGYEETAPGASTEGVEEVPGARDVAVRVEGHLGTGEANGVEQARMDSAVGNDKVARGCEGSDDGKIGLVSGRKEERALAPNESGKSTLQLQVLGEGSAEQAGCAGSKAGASAGFAGCLKDSGVGGKAEVVVGAERGQGSRVLCDMGPGRSVDAGTGAKPVGSLEGLQFSAELAGEGREHGLRMLKYRRAVSTALSG
jgi:hypothetical protein